MITPIPGSFSRIYLSEYGTTMASTLIGCTTSDVWNGNTELVEVTGLTADFVEYLPTYKSATLTADTMLVTQTNNEVLASAVLLQWQLDGTLLDFSYDYDTGGNLKQIVGTCYISSLSIQGSANEYCTVSITLQCTAAWDIV